MKRTAAVTHAKVLAGKRCPPLMRARRLSGSPAPTSPAPRRATSTNGQAPIEASCKKATRTQQHARIRSPAPGTVSRRQAQAPAGARRHVPWTYYRLVARARWRRTQQAPFVCLSEARDARACTTMRAPGSCFPADGIAVFDNPDRSPWRNCY